MASSQGGKRVNVSSTSDDMPDTFTLSGKMVGAQVRRVEDPRVLLGKSQYVDDLDLPNSVALAFVRSPYAHARIVSVDVGTAQNQPGVRLIVTGADIAEAIKPLRVEYEPDKAPTHKPCDWPVLAQGKVRFVGEAVAVVVAADRYAAEDASSLVDVEYEPLEPVSDVEQALYGAGRTRLFPEKIGPVHMRIQEHPVEGYVLTGTVHYEAFRRRSEEYVSVTHFPLRSLPTASLALSTTDKNSLMNIAYQSISIGGTTDPRRQL